MMPQFTWRLAGQAAVIVAGGSLAIATVLYVRGLVEDKTRLTAENQSLREDVTAYEAREDAYAANLKEWQQNADQLIDLMGEVVRTNREATEETRRLNAIFAEHDLEDLALQKPILVEGAINSGSDRMRRLLECASQAGCAAGHTSAPGQSDAP